jgi:hypothetical protein
VCSPSQRTSGERLAARRDAIGSVGGQELRDERAELVSGDEQPEVAVVENVQRGVGSKVRMIRAFTSGINGSSFPARTRVGCRMTGRAGRLAQPTPHRGSGGDPGGCPACAGIW